MTEAAWQAQVIELAQLYGWLVYHTYDARRSEPGFPDLVLVRHRVLYVELKTDRGRLRPAQRTWLAALEAAGQDVAVWRPRDFEELVHPALRERGPYPPIGEPTYAAA